MRVPMPSAVVVKDLVHGWRVRETGSSDTSWLSVKRVPVYVHEVLLDHGRIADPFCEFNELDAQWVGERPWTFETRLAPLSASETRSCLVLALDGLDTFASVRLNGTLILRTSSQFIPYRVDLSRSFDCRRTNVLSIDFEPPLPTARRILDTHPDHKWICWNGNPARLAVRKAAYHFGWDWGPVLLSSGPWRPVRLETYDVRIEDLWTEYNLDLNLELLEGTFSAIVDGPFNVDVALKISFRGQTVAEQVFHQQGGRCVSMKYKIAGASLWYPHGYGPQSLYEFSVELASEHRVIIDSRSKKIGFRKAELVREPDSLGESFFFRINGVDIFCGGANWIPADSFVTRVNKTDYRRWIEAVAGGNMTMIRVWGGGIWESEDFFDACDECGILVWQDFLFACGNYPGALKSFLASVHEEAVANLRRIRHHPCIVVYAGNNEDYQVQEQAGLTYDYEEKDPQKWLQTDFPARFIYEKLLPEIVAAESPHVPYHPGSPWGGGRPTSDPTIGDLHQWSVWHGAQAKYQLYDQLSGRFNTEFGLESLPSLETIKYYCKKSVQSLYPQSAMLDFHNKAADHERKIAIYLVENFRWRTDLRGFIHLTQMAQAEALSFAFQGWRKRWASPAQRLCGGSLVWQLNDVWPGTSWSVVDYFLRKKPAYYLMARALAPIAVGVQRKHHDWSGGHARPAKSSDYELWVSSGLLKEQKASVELRFVSVSSGSQVHPNRLFDEISVAPNGTTLVARGTIENLQEEPHVLAARVSIEGKVVARHVDWPQPYKYLEFKNRGLSIKRTGGELIVNATRPIKGLVFEETEPPCSFSDNALDIVPGDEQIVVLRGPHTDKASLNWTFLGDDE